MTFQPVPNTLVALQGLLAALTSDGHHIDEALLRRTKTPWSDVDAKTVGQPCPFGCAERVWVRHDMGGPVGSIGPVSLTFRLTKAWVLHVVLIAPPSYTFPEQEVRAPRRWSDATLSAIEDLVDRGDGFVSFEILDAATHQPKGVAQECDRGWVAQEWVDQSCGFAGDDYSGTVTWKMGQHLLVGTFFS